MPAERCLITSRAHHLIIGMRPDDREKAPAATLAHRRVLAAHVLGLPIEKLVAEAVSAEFVQAVVHIFEALFDFGSVARDGDHGSPIDAGHVSGVRCPHRPGRIDHHAQRERVDLKH